ncbi:MAG: transposase [Candidatus Omnitrophota bacterium]
MPRVFVENALYYVTCKSLPNQSIFREKGDYNMYFELMKRYKEQYGVNIYAYNLMPSHLHLLMEVDEKTTISTIMHNINSTYTKYYNSRYERKGHLFRERFKAALIEKEPKVLLNLTAYMHLSVKKMEVAIQGQTHPYSSYSLYLDYNQQSDHGLNIKNEIAAVLSGLIDENYSQYLQKAEQSMDFKKMHKQLQRKGMLGSSAFLESVKNKIEQFREAEAGEKETAQLKPDLETAENNVQNAKGFNPMGLAILILVLTSAGMYLYFDYTRNSAKPQIEEKADKIQEVIKQEPISNLERTEWELKLFAANGQEVKTDTLSFNNGKVVSAYLAGINYPKSNYSLVFEGDKLIWETMQTSPSGTASWRGEVKNEKMSGILSLRQKGKQTQVFSFENTKYRRK